LLFSYAKNYISCCKLEIKYIINVTSERIQFPVIHMSRFIVPYVEQVLPTLPEHLSSLPVFSGVRVVRPLVFCVMFCRSFLSFYPFFFRSLYCPFFFDIRLLVTTLSSSNFSISFHLLRCKAIILYISLVCKCKIGKRCSHDHQLWWYNIIVYLKILLYISWFSTKLFQKWLNCLW